MTIVQQAFSNALFENRHEVNIIDFKKAIMNSKNIYPDVIKKSIPEFDKIFEEQLDDYTIKNKTINLERLAEE